MAIKAVLKTKTPCEVIVEVEVERSNLDAAYEKTFKQNNKLIELPGFRAGKAPREMVERQFRDQLQAHAIEDLAGAIVRSVVKQNNLEPITSPKMVEEPEYPATGSLKFSVEFEVAPVVKLDDYSGIKLTKNKAEFSDDKIDEVITKALDRFATYEEITEERGAVFGDWVVADYVATSDGKEILKRDSAWIDVNTGTNQPITGFGNEVQGIKKNETREFTAVAPENFFKKDFVGKEIKFTVTALDIRERIIPPISDELAKKIDSSLNTVEELRQAITKNQLVYLDDQENARLKELIREQLVKKYKLPVPPAMVAGRTRSLVEQEARAMMQKGQTQEDVEAKVEELQKSCALKAEFQVAAEFILAAVAVKENIKISYADIEPALQYYAQAFKKDTDWVYRMFERDGKLDGFYIGAREDKALDAILAVAEIKEK